MNRNDHVYIAFHDNGEAMTVTGKPRMYMSAEKAAKVGIEESSLVEYAPVDEVRAAVEADASKLQASEKIKLALGIFLEIERELFVLENKNSIVVCFYRSDYEALKETIFKKMENKGTERELG